MDSKWEEVELDKIIDFNPRESIKKGTIAKKVSMSNIEIKQKNIREYSLEEYKSGTKFRNGDTLFARITPCLENGKTSKVNFLEKNEVAFGSTEFIVLRNKNGISDNDFIYYLSISSNLRSIATKSMVGSSGRQRVQLDVLKNTSMYLPPLSTQKAIADILSALDDKIECNNKINKNLEEQAQALFKHWFVDFEFPNEEGKPYKTSGGKMVESELGLIPEGWEVGNFGEIIELHDSKRIPLSSRERNRMNKNYPYYGAATLVDYVEEYIFDGDFLLLGEDGTVSDERGYPVVQYVFGKFWVNNHAHVITGKNGYSVGNLYMLFKNTNVNTIITGAVQKKINQTNLKKLEVIIPKESILKLYNEIIDSIFRKRKLKENQNQVLANIRDTLLPKLMSGEIEVPVEE